MAAAFVVGDVVNVGGQHRLGHDADSAGVEMVQVDVIGNALRVAARS